MDYIIAPTLFENKTCRLPGIGTFYVVTSTAQTDFVNAQISAPQQSIIFTAAQDDEKVFNEFTALSNLIIADLDENGTVSIKGIGAFIKKNDGKIEFTPQLINTSFIPDIAAERLNKQPVEHSILVGDIETNSTAMIEYYDEETKRSKNKWWIWAIVLGMISIAILVSYFLSHKYNFFGNL